MKSSNFQNQKNRWSASSSSSSSSAAAAVEETNLQKLLRAFTPRPLSHSLLPSCSSSRQPNKGAIECFKLGELWSFYEEWSAFGVGVRVRLANGETTTQYYVPYLSAIQIYTNKTMQAIARILRDEAGETETEESWSDDSGSEKISRATSHGSGKTWDPALEDSCSEPDNNNGCHLRDRLGYHYFEYFESSSPYYRIPLTDQMNALAKEFPGLMNLRSVDIAPASWMSVAWYPIYNIPSRKKEKDLSACFLTYHTLSSSFLDEKAEEHKNSKLPRNKKMAERRIPLTPFGLATYKMKGDIWVNPETRDPKRLADLRNAAGSWLKQLGVFHHDLNFFNLHSYV